MGVRSTRNKLRNVSMFFNLLNKLKRSSPLCASLLQSLFFVPFLFFFMPWFFYNFIEYQCEGYGCVKNFGTFWTFVTTNVE
jgi:hypothetical protein